MTRLNIHCGCFVSSEPSLALYVRSLSIFLPKMPVIMPSTLPCSSMVARGNRKRSWRAPWSSRTSSHEDTTPSPADGMVVSEAELLSIIFGMKKLETLHIESFIPHRWSPDAFWSTFRWSLRSLTFTSGNISSWRLKDAVCDSLSDLTIRSACQCGHEAQWSFPSLNKNMGQFINAHSGTLRSLAMTIIVCSSCKYDNRLLLESMARLSMLETLFLTFTSSFVKSGQAEQVKTADAVQGLIYSTRLPVLKHLILSVPRALYSSILSMPDPNSHVPPLQSYELRSIVADNDDWEPRRIAADLPDFRRHLGHFVSTLTKLDIGALIFTFEELKQVISLFSGCSLHSMGASSSLQTSSPLTDFRCSVEHIDAAIFLYIAATLPQLQTFSLGYVTFRPTPSDLVLPHLPRLGGLTLPTQVVSLQIIHRSCNLL